MLPLSAILHATPAKIKQRAQAQCFGQAYAPPRGKTNLTKVGGYPVEDDTGKYTEFKYRVKCTDGWRKVAARFYGPVSIKTPTWCWCSCPYFKYHCEVALASKGSSAVVQSNGQRPRFTNSKMLPRVCKHVYLLFTLAAREMKKVDKLTKERNQDQKAVKKRADIKKAAQKKKEQLKKKESERKEKEKKRKAAVEEKREQQKEAREERTQQAAEKRAEQQAANAEKRVARIAAQREKIADQQAKRSGWHGDKKK